MLVVRIGLDVLRRDVERRDESRACAVRIECAGIYRADAVLNDDGGRRGDIFARVRRDDYQVEFVRRDPRVG